ncbi:MAG TPA: hypothetical protein VMX55_01565 [candidate division Zixibacteria bacterium]|nr:hypothetical protein [candidate division Zixibacteria bacterium]
MSKKENKTKKPVDIKVLKESLLGGEGISDVEARRQKFVERRSVKHEVDEEKRKKITDDINQGLQIKTNISDFLIFFISQFIPLLIIGSTLFVPGMIKLADDLYFLILIIFGGFLYLYAFIRLISTLSYKIEIGNEKIKWRNVFWWKEVPNKDILEINAIPSYYTYFTKIGGVGRIGVEVIQIKTGEKEYWVRAYPLRKKTGDELVIILKCWSDIHL